MLRLFFGGGVLGKPGEVVGGAPDGGQGNNFGNVVAVETLDFGLEGGKLFFDGFDDQQLFAGCMNLSLPAIDGLHGTENDGHAGGQMLANHFAGNAASFDEIAASDQNEASRFRTSHRLLRELTAGYQKLKLPATKTSKTLSLRRWRV